MSSGKCIAVTQTPIEAKYTRRLINYHCFTQLTQSRVMLNTQINQSEGRIFESQPITGLEADYSPFPDNNLIQEQTRPIFHFLPSFLSR